MSALSVIQSNLISSTAGLLTNTTGGTSQGNNAAGTSSSDSSTNAEDAILSPVTSKDRAAAGILTAVVLSGLWGWWDLWLFD
jgi:mannan endo-1,6-alpha-mannosidase